MQQAGSGTLALRRGRFKYIEPSQGAPVSRNTGIELGHLPSPQLYDLEADPGEARNRAAERPDLVREMAALLDTIRKDGRSRP